MSQHIQSIPENGILGLKNNWKSDIVSGFLVFLLALPLSLGIAKASGFPASMGVLSAIIGGVLVSQFKVSALTIKGPAAGLITICSSAVLEFGGESEGWKIVASIIVISSILQILFGFLKFGSLSDFFPYSTIHGMLAAIGLIIIAKQFPVLMGDDPLLYKGESPVELIMDIPRFVLHAHWHIAVIGVLGLFIMFITPLIKIKWLKKVPAPMLVLLVAVPLTFIWHIKQTEPSYSLVSIGDFWGNIGLNANFSYITTFAFWKYVIMFVFVGSLESLLTVKATDHLDPYIRKSDYNADLKAQGVGNFVSGFLGGLPMISEVVRSSANVGFGAKTKWSNFFQGVFLLLAMLLMIPIIEMIPNSALAAMLIYAGYRLAAPKEFINVYKIGKEQLLIFLTTIIITLLEDLLLGVCAGIIVKLLFHLYYGVSVKTLFKSYYTVEEKDKIITVKILESAIFSNLISFKKFFMGLDAEKEIIVDFSQTKLIDHSFLEFIHHLQHEQEANHQKFRVKGLEHHKKLSKHPYSTCVLKKR